MPCQNGPEAGTFFWACLSVFIGNVFISVITFCAQIQPYFLMQCVITTKSRYQQFVYPYYEKVSYEEYLVSIISGSPTTDTQSIQFCFKNKLI